MMIYTYNRSKKKKQTKKQIDEYNKWLDSVNKQPSITGKKVLKSKTNFVYSLSTPIGRETPKYNSLNTGFVPCTKKEANKYTGDNMKGIGTLHKSNAVPIFTNEEAKDQANMRR